MELTSIDNIIEEFIKEKHKNLLQNIEELKETNKGILKENVKLIHDVETLKTKSNLSPMLQLIHSKINDENIKDVCDLLLPIDNIITSQFKNDTPLWFSLLVRHWGNREFIVSILHSLNIELPSWINNIKMPYEYNEDELDIFFKTLSNHFVCNGCIFSDNLGFWYQEFSQFQFDIKKSLNNQYSEIPWQLILSNPLLLKEKYILKITEALNKKKEHSQYLLHIFRYQNFNQDQMKLFINNLNYGVGKETDKLIEKNIHLIENKKQSSLIIDKFLKGDIYIDISLLDEKYQKQYYLQSKDINKIISTKYLTKEEKLELIKNMIL